MSSGYFDYNKQQKDFEYIQKSKENIKANFGKIFCYLLSKDYDRYRGYISPRYGRITDIKYNNVFINDGDDVIDFRDILEIAVKKESDE